MYDNHSGIIFLLFFAAVVAVRCWKWPPKKKSGAGFGDVGGGDGGDFGGGDFGVGHGGDCGGGGAGDGGGGCH